MNKQKKTLICFVLCLFVIPCLLYVTLNQVLEALGLLSLLEKNFIRFFMVDRL
jgi:hypothetical protein